MLWVHFDGVLMPHVLRELNADADAVFHDVHVQKVSGIFRRLIALAARESPDDEPAISALLSSLIAELFALRTEALALPAAEIDLKRCSEPIRSALTKISRYYMRPKNIKVLAARIGLSRYYFTRLFHRETGHTPSHYLNLYRMEAARNLLTATDKPIARSRTVGIPNAENFSKLFRRRHGESPRTYRARNAQK